MKLFICILISSIVFISTYCSKIKDNENLNSTNESKQDVELKLKEKVANKDCTYGDLIGDLTSVSSELNKNKTIGDFVFEAEYQPHLLLAILNQDSVESTKKIDRVILKKTEDYNRLHYLKFTIENKKFKSELLRYNAETPDDYSGRISYYSFHIKNDVYLIENSTDTLKGGFVNFERTFDMSPKLNLTFVFERRKTTPINKLTFVYEDVIFNNGKLNFEFDYQKFSFLNAPDFKKTIL
jgi:hypothetical protein